MGPPAVFVDKSIILSIYLECNPLKVQSKSTWAVVKLEGASEGQVPRGGPESEDRARLGL